MKPVFKFFVTFVWWVFVLIISCKKDDNLKPQIEPVSRAGDDQVVSFPADSVNLTAARPAMQMAALKNIYGQKFQAPILSQL